MANKTPGRAADDGPEVPRPTDSQAQQAAGSVEQKRAADPETLANKTGERQNFDGTVAKVDKDGKTVMSNYLDPGETLRRDVTDKYDLTPTARREREEEEKKQQAKKDDDK